MSSLYHNVKIGNLNLEGNLFLAPLAGYTDRVFRSICIRHGASFTYTEMVSAEGAARKGEKTLELMERGEKEKNLAIQLFAPDAETIKRSLDTVLSCKPSVIDINCGCPVPKVIKTYCGSALLKSPQTIKSIVKTITENCDVPVTVKIRTGWDLESINFLTNAEAAVEGGASAICMHARTRSQYYAPKANWDTLTSLKSHFPELVIIGSGDLFTAQDGKRMLEETQVDAIAFARGAIGNPFIFEQTKALLTGKEVREICTAEKKEAIFAHLKGLSAVIGENGACREMRKHVCAYLKGIPGSSKAKQLIIKALKIEDYQRALEELA